MRPAGLRQRERRQERDDDEAGTAWREHAAPKLKSAFDKASVLQPMRPALRRVRSVKLSKKSPLNWPNWPRQPTGSRRP